MSTQNLSSVTIEIIGQYHQAGQRLARAYERGLQRAADAIGGQLTKFLEKRELPLVDADVKLSTARAERVLAVVGRPLELSVPSNPTGLIAPSGELLALYRPTEAGSRPVAVLV